ncbi:MAG: UDP-N-acetylmuramate--L-alanine ligase [Clostridia bacterium]|nr:UDP-N-acetylmuramate--L-alanine ligase [Clostridia bacterium]
MFENINSVYFIGIGGISMSALAMLIQSKGIKVCGSDDNLSSVTENLQKKGIEVIEGRAPNLVKECDICVVSGAISDDNEDLFLANRLGKKILSRAELLGELASEKKCISIAGTHGKTTTTGMLATIMLKAGLDPTIHIGGILNEIDSNLHIGSGEYFLTEACEYKDSFLSLSSDISVVLNVEPDHLDYFKSFDNLRNSFKKFVKNTKKYGFSVINGDILSNFEQNVNVLTFGLGEENVITAKNIREYAAGKFAYDLYVEEEFVGEISLSSFGKHNVENSLAAVAVSLLLDIDFAVIQAGLAEYKGAKRRMDVVREKSPMIIHDYAHHPTEIEGTLLTCKSINKKVIAIFQPHTYSRTRDLYEQFLSCFSLCEQVWLLPIYSAREEPIENISSLRLSKELNVRGIKSKYFASMQDCQNAIKGVKNDCLFAVLGAGDIEKLAELLRK